MSITATCTNCGKSYQAPDALAGRKVRCKDCGTIFEIERPLAFSSDEPPDLSALEGLVSESMAGSESPAPKRGRSTAEPVRARPADVEDIEIATNAIAVRPNYRFAFPGSKEVDQFLPFVLIGGIVAWLAMIFLNSVPGFPLIGLSRYVLLLVCFFGIIAPCIATATGLAARTVGYQLPKNPFLRSTASYIPTLLITILVWMSGSHDSASFFMGLALGSLVSVGFSWLLFRLFPNEIPLTGLIAIGGLLAGVAVSAGALFVVNLIAISIVTPMKLEAMIPESPIAMGMAWVEAKPQTPQDASTPVQSSTNTHPVTGGDIPKPAVVTPSEAERTAAIIARVDLSPIYVPALDSKMVRMKIDESADSPLIGVLAPYLSPGFQSAIRPLPSGEGIGLIRGEQIELVSLKALQQTQVLKPYSRSQFGNPAISPDGQRIARVAPAVQNVVLVDERGNTNQVQFDFPAEASSIFGFADRSTMILLGKGGLEFIEVAVDREGQGVSSLKMQMDGADLMVLNPADPGSTIVPLADGSGLIGAGREPTGKTPVIGIWHWGDTTKPTKRFAVVGSDSFVVNPLGMAASPTGDRIAALFESGQFITLVVGDATGKDEAPTKQRVLQGIKPAAWEAGYAPVVWLDDRTILVYGTQIIDTASASNPRTLATVNPGSIVGTLPSVGPVVPIVVMSNGQHLLAFEVIDMALVEKARAH